MFVQVDGEDSDDEDDEDGEFLREAAVNEAATTTAAEMIGPRVPVTTAPAERARILAAQDRAAIRRRRTPIQEVFAAGEEARQHGWQCCSGGATTRPSSLRGRRRRA